MGLGLQEMLLGVDPMQPEVIWETLYRGSKMTGRRGALICAMGAIDMALWDIKGQALGVPIARLLGGDPSRPVTPYASLLPTGKTLEAYRDSLVEKAVQAKALGYRAQVAAEGVRFFARRRREHRRRPGPAPAQAQVQANSQAKLAARPPEGPFAQLGELVVRHRQH